MSEEERGEAPKRRGRRRRSNAGVRSEPPRALRDRRAQRRATRREQLAWLCVTMVGEMGFRDVPIAELCRRAGVSTRSFYESFAGKEECFAAGLEMRSGPLLDRAEAAFTEATGAWEDRLRAGLTSILEDLASDPSYARACTSEVLQAGPVAEGQLREAITRGQRIFACEDNMFPPPPVGGDPLDSMAVGAVLRPIQGLLRQGRPELLPDLVPYLVSFLKIYRTRQD